jgi:hypothetical protein
MSSGQAMEWILNNTANSLHHALTYEGYKIEPFRGQIKGVPEMGGEDKDFLRTMGIKGSKK